MAEQLYATGNYDAMYLAGMIAEPKKMTEEDFNRWMEGLHNQPNRTKNAMNNFIMTVGISYLPLHEEGNENCPGSRKSRNEFCSSIDSKCS